MRKWKTNEAFVYILLTNYSVISQVKGRFVHQAIDCNTADVPRCSSLTSASCQTHCVNLGFSSGTCDPNGDCCICFSDTPPPTIQVEEKPTPNYIAIAVKSANFIEPEHENTVPPCQNNDDICLTPGCVSAAAKLLDKMNLEADPCDNFYEFACGGFMKKTTIPDDKAEINPLNKIGDKLIHQIRALVETSPSPTEPKPFRLVKQLYNSCVNIPVIESHGLNPLTNILHKLGGWPVLEGNAWKSENWEWLTSIYKFGEVGYATGYFLRLAVSPDLKNSTRNVIIIDEPALSIGREQFSIPPFVRAYHKYQIDLAVLLGANPVDAQREMRDVLDFERKLADISVPKELKRNATKFYNPTTLTDLQKQFPTIPWLTYLQRILPSNIKIRHGERIILSAPSQLATLIKLLETTDKRILANYVMWRAASSSVRYLNTPARALEFQFSSMISGQRQLPLRWKECVGVVSSGFPHAISALYVRRHFREDAREAAISMVDDIRQAFLESLNKVDWMDDNTKSLAWEKASSMAAHIGFPQELLDDQALTDLYKNLDFTSEDYMENILALTVASTKYAMEKLRQMNDKSDWKAYGKVAIANAFYSPMQNSIQFPAGILQENFFGSDRPKYLNYGAIGWVIGHEISHSLDDQGRMFDSQGNLKEWWDPFTKGSYLKKTQCMIHQYGQFTYTDPLTKRTIPLNGFISQGENIADNGGLKVAYQGYQTWLNKNGVEKKLPGLPYTPNQLFWISAANNWCSKQRPESMMQSLLTAVHLPGEFRVRGTMANMKQFAIDFNCPLRTNMNPVNKCAVW